MNTPSMQQPSDRRSVPAREHHWSKAAARYLAKADVAPDTISVYGVVAALAAALALACTAVTSGALQHGLWIIAGTLTGLRLTCNMLDGMVAVEWGKSSPLGPLYNEVPDRIADVAILVGAGYSFGGHAALGYIAASLALFTAYVRVAARSIGAPSDFGGPMAKPQRMAIVILTCAYLGFTPTDWHVSWGAAQQYGLMSIALALIATGSALTAALRLRRAAQHLCNAGKQ